MPGLVRTLLALPPALAVALTAVPAVALPLAATAGLERAAPARDAVLLPVSVIVEPLLLPGAENIAELEGPPLDNVPEPDTLAILGGAIAAFALVALIRRNRRGK